MPDTAESITAMRARLRPNAANPRERITTTSLFPAKLSPEERAVYMESSDARHKFPAVFDLTGFPHIKLLYGGENGDRRQSCSSRGFPIVVEDICGM